ncbi:hypothetical protein KY290_037239 [Solanum tuberosum]|uniref:Uncharacterized protein n=1 Tax=Solanum tuberosum TaxID=4113 RepID=A0ABQ7TUY2_SOLTU|nr:hypothetical protein KY285_036539 [Solanum tuberosum]KAH0639956.1 hypothetical protein KY285_036542 [Solanum tuberosum]KAH0738530.1 hypothetical protein KY290_037235 [Solanum tuberosum]KAH0738534.1 hypothetical protein KY290_037239 [Solanum tuberosum]
MSLLVACRRRCWWPRVLTGKEERDAGAEPLSAGCGCYWRCWSPVGAAGLLVANAGWSSCSPGWLSSSAAAATLPCRRERRGRRSEQQRGGGDASSGFAGGEGS